MSAWECLRRIGEPTKEHERANAEVQLDKMSFGIPWFVVWQHCRQFVVETFAANGYFGDSHVDSLMRMLIESGPDEMMNDGIRWPFIRARGNPKVAVTFVFDSHDPSSDGHKRALPAKPQKIQEDGDFAEWKPTFWGSRPDGPSGETGDYASATFVGGRVRRNGESHLSYTINWVSAAKF
jgi:hypothetical protein